ncbi:hypothetical protein CO172_02395 [Candidatus Uhrbacteria bacterium CG_4_9_14_3_um_filter_36_7]|uniref:Uncharacterized protein n=1 Tax=Candidatus Uhrbacteria bacterium CG_4_9_14_3_um_filter_36_7 TaxID=1975033 RepID=A0A2M7XHA4_9BACT|nr:MAG: hypothetical protein CO172_02395 [Candidatus Uhrbacteria bacterium CG_4_9_14_3_um_filter_36_7]
MQIQEPTLPFPTENLDYDIIEVITQTFLHPPIPDIDRVIKNADYEPYIAPKERMLKEADKTRIEYLKKV